MPNQVTQQQRVALNGNKLFLRQVICSFLGFIDNLQILFYKRNKKNLVAVWLSSYNGTLDACETRGCRLAVYTHLSWRYNTIITRDIIFIS